MSEDKATEAVHAQRIPTRARFTGIESFDKIDAEQVQAEQAKAVEDLDDVGSESLHGIEETVCVLQADERLAPELARVGQD
ncbi:MAG: hypothetical protein M1826_007409 [Phylliscum demangeonii]|nr:MAG: hypothetical protein M1826_007409 [Phylliscum demangeonii]